jgi:predicted  nucleic acid-binding Zn-ribbon protein
MKDIMKDLSDLKIGIDNAKVEIAKSEGREQELLRRLKKDHGLSSLKEVQKKISSLKKDTEDLEKTIRADYKKLKEEFEW